MVRWKTGQSLQEIGRAFGRVTRQFAVWSRVTGGFVPAVRWRSLLALNRDLNEIVSQIGGHAFPALCRGLVWG
jgi:hypothetical protein